MWFFIPYIVEDKDYGELFGLSKNYFAYVLGSCLHININNWKNIFFPAYSSLFFIRVPCLVTLSAYPYLHSHILCCTGSLNRVKYPNLVYIELEYVHNRAWFVSGSFCLNRHELGLRPTWYEHACAILRLNLAIPCPTRHRYEESDTILVLNPTQHEYCNSWFQSDERVKLKSKHFDHWDMN